MLSSMNPRITLMQPTWNDISDIITKGEDFEWEFQNVHSGNQVMDFAKSLFQV